MRSSFDKNESASYPSNKTPISHPSVLFLHRALHLNSLHCQSSEVKGWSGTFPPKSSALSHVWKMASGSSSTSDVTCPVCLKHLHGRVLRELGKPKNCNHFFCLSCILEWSKVCTEEKFLPFHPQGYS